VQKSVKGGVGEKDTAPFRVCVTELISYSCGAIECDWILQALGLLFCKIHIGEAQEEIGENSFCCSEKGTCLYFLISQNWHDLLPYIMSLF